MRFYNQQRRYYCGIDLHSRSMYLCIVDNEGRKVFHKNIRADAEEFLAAVAPYREGLVVGAECVYCWYWLSDVCHAEEIEFVIGHALYMKAIHGAKDGDDRKDAEKIALLLKSGMFPLAYVYPAEMRATRDLMRRRLFFVRRKSELLTHIQMTHHQYNLESPKKRLSYRGNRKGVGENFADAAVRKSLEADLTMLAQYEKTIRELELHILRSAKIHDSRVLALLQSIPGIGEILALTILYEIHDIKRFPTVQKFSSYSRLVKPKKTSVGKTKARGGGKIGNAHLRWAFSEASVLFVRNCETGAKYHERLTKKHGKAKAYTYTGHKLGRTVYFMLERGQSFNEARFLN